MNSLEIRVSSLITPMLIEFVMPFGAFFVCFFVGWVDGEKLNESE